MATLNCLENIFIRDFKNYLLLIALSLCTIPGFVYKEAYFHKQCLLVLFTLILYDTVYGYRKFTVRFVYFHFSPGIEMTTVLFSAPKS